MIVLLDMKASAHQQYYVLCGHEVILSSELSGKILTFADYCIDFLDNLPIEFKAEADCCRLSAEYGTVFTFVCHASDLSCHHVWIMLMTMKTFGDLGSETILE